MALAYFIILNNEFLYKNPDVVPEQASLIILDRKSDIYMANNDKETKHNIHIYIKMNLVRNGDECTRKCGVREVWNWKKLELRMVGNMN